MIISSQRYRNPEIVEAKRQSGDYEVSLVSIEIDGVEYDVVVDGHHSLSAAITDGVEPDWTYVGGELQAEADNMSAEDFLAAHYNDSDYYDVATGNSVWQ